MAKFPRLLALSLCVVPASAFANDKTVSCLLEVDGRVYLQGVCYLSPLGDGGFTIGAKQSPHFAYVTKNDDGTADASWNENPKSTHAGTHLGIVKQEGTCWVNARAKICAR